MAPERRNRTSANLIAYRFEACTHNHARSSRQRIRKDLGFINILQLSSKMSHTPVSCPTTVRRGTNGYAFKESNSPTNQLQFCTCKAFSVEHVPFATHRLWRSDSNLISLPTITLILIYSAGPGLFVMVVVWLS